MSAAVKMMSVGSSIGAATARNMMSSATSGVLSSASAARTSFPLTSTSSRFCAIQGLPNARSRSFSAAGPGEEPRVNFWEAPTSIPKWKVMLVP